MEKEEIIKKEIREFFDRMSFALSSIELSAEKDTSTLVCAVATEQPSLLVGRNGEALAAINHLIKRVLEKRLESSGNSQNSLEENLFIDVDGYQKKRIETIKEAAHMIAERALFFKSSIAAEPMSSFERRIVHEFLAKKSNIKTESAGEGSKRHVVISHSVEI